MMQSKRIPALRALFVVLGLILAACGTAPRPASPSASAPTKTAEDSTDPADDEDDDDATDADGDVEASSELARPSAPCPRNMVLVASAEGARFCIDKYEASLVEVDGDGNEKPFPHWLPVDGHTVRAVSEPDVFPQGFISEVQAEDACAASSKRLCSHAEWKTACMGPEKTTFPYGAARRPGACHDTGKSAVAAVFGLKALADPVATAPASKPARVAGAKSTTAPPRGNASKPAANTKPAADAKTASRTKTAKPGRQAHVTTKGRAAETTKPRATRPGTATAKAEKPSKRRGEKTERTAARSSKRVPSAAKASARPMSVAPSVWTQLNDPRLGQVDGALAKTGSHEECVNGYGALDMVGNLHEWVKTDRAAPHGTFAGGYYLDTTLNGDGCQYRTTAHAHDYHDYSTGFRCCAEAGVEEPTASRDAAERTDAER